MKGTVNGDRRKEERSPKTERTKTGNRRVKTGN